MLIVLIIIILIARFTGDRFGIPGDSLWLPSLPQRSLLVLPMRNIITTREFGMLHQMTGMKWLLLLLVVLLLRRISLQRTSAF